MAANVQCPASFGIEPGTAGALTGVSRPAPLRRIRAMDAFAAPSAVHTHPRLTEKWGVRSVSAGAASSDRPRVHEARLTVLIPRRRGSAPRTAEAAVHRIDGGRSDPRISGPGPEFPPPHGDVSRLCQSHARADRWPDGFEAQFRAAW